MKVLSHRKSYRLRMDGTRKRVCSYVSVTGPKEPTRRHRVALVIVFMVLIFERIGYHSLYYSLDFTTPSDSESRMLLLLGIRAGGQFILPLVGAWFGECLFGVHTTAVFGTVLEFIGASLLFTSTLIGSGAGNASSNQTDWTVPDWVPTYSSSQVRSLVLGGLVLVMLGLSLTRSNYLMLAAAKIPELKLVETGFFRWYYCATEVGGVVAIGILSWMPVDVLAFCWPACLFISLMLLLVVRGVSNYDLNQTSRQGFRKLLECFTCSSAQRDEQMLRFRAHMFKLFLFIGMQLPYFFLYTTLHEPVFPYNTTVNPELVPVVYLYEPLSIIIIILTSFLILPILNTSTTNSLKCIVLGMVFITVSCIIAAIRDWFGGDGDNFSLYAGTQFPKYFVPGLAEVFCYVNALEFVYMETPKHLKNQMIGLYLTVIGMGYGVALAPIIVLEGPFFPSQRVLLWSIVGAVNIIFCLMPFVIFFREYKNRREQEYSVSAVIDEVKRSRTQGLKLNRERQPLFGGSALEESEDSIFDGGNCCS